MLEEAAQDGGVATGESQPGRGSIWLRIAVRSILRCVVFTVLILVIFTLIAGGDLLRRVLLIRRVQPELVGRHLSALVVQFGVEDGGVGVAGDRRLAPSECRTHHRQLRTSLLPEGGELSQIQAGVPSRGKLQGRPGTRPSRGTLPGLKPPICHLQPVDILAGGARNLNAWIEGG